MSLTCMCTYPYTDNIDAYKGEEKKKLICLHIYRYTCISVSMQNIMLVVVEYFYTSQHSL